MMLHLRNGALLISTKITLAMVTLLAMTLLIGTSLFVQQQKISLQTQFQAQGVLVADLLVELLEAKQAVPDEDWLQRFRERLGRSGEINGIWLLGPEGEVLGSALASKALTSGEELTAEITSRIDLSGSLRSSSSVNLIRRFLSSPAHPVGSVGIVMSREALSESVRAARFQTWVVSCLVFAFGVLAAMAISRTLSRPLRQLVAVTQRGASGESPVSDGDEVTQLTDSFQTFTSRFVENLSKEVDAVDELMSELEGTSKALKGSQLELQQRTLSEQALKEECSLLTAQLGEKTKELGRVHAELISTSQVRDQFLASMSHELRTPLNAVLGLSEVLRDESYGAVNSRQLSFLDSITESGQQLLGVINDLLDFARLEAGEYQLELTRIPIAEVCQASLDSVQQEAVSKKVEVSWHLPSATAMIQADRRCLTRMLMNLLANAVKFTSQGGRIGLDVRLEEEPQIVHFSVWDTGIGIASPDLRQLFQPFVQLDSRLARRFGGTGLGLSLVYQLAELHGGSVSVESELHRGSRFTVSLPLGSYEDRLETQTAGDQMHGKRAWPGGDQPVILIAEDNLANIQALRAIVEASGYGVLVAENGRQAIELARRRVPDLIIMDVQMPEMDGLEATRVLRRDPQLASLPIIALTALAMPGDEKRCIDAGMDAYLSKPVRLGDLQVVMEDWIHRGAARRSLAGPMTGDAGVSYSVDSGSSVGQTPT